MAKIDLSVIIVSYNVKEFLHQTLLSVQKAAKGLNCEIWVVDNASLDGTAAFVEKSFPEVKLIANNENLGFGKANNQALRQASGKYVLFLNPDTIVQDDTFSTMIRFMEANEQIALSGCKILNADGTLQAACRRSIPTPGVAIPKMLGLSRLFPKSKLFGRYNLTYLDPDKSYPVDAVSGSFMFARTSLMQALGGFDEAFFMYGEDLDLCYRVKKAGYEIWYVAETSIIHYKGESSRFAPFDSIVAFYKAMDIFVGKHFSQSYSLIFTILLRLGIALHLSMRAVGKLLYAIRIPLMDGLSVYLAFGLALAIRFHEWLWFWGYQKVIFLYAAIYLLSGLFWGIYQQRRYQVIIAAASVFTGALLSGSLSFFLPQIAHSRLVFALAFIFLLLFVPGWRILHQLWPGRQHNSASQMNRTIVVGSGAEAHRIANAISSRLKGDYLFMGFADDAMTDPRIIATLDTLAEVIRIRRIRTVIFTSDTVGSGEMMRQMHRLRQLPVQLKIVPENLNMIYGKANIERFDDISVVDLDYSLNRFLPRFLKRAFDSFLALILLLILTLPSLFAILFLGCRWVALNSDISGLKWQRNRSGKSCIGFFPLLPKILTGKVSFVGDMLSLPPGSDRYFLPGITGLIQLEHKGRLTAEQHQRFMHYYLRNQSLLLDMDILVRTVFGKGV
ncbi:MAG TPA: glycosyltransferase [Candidatus Marinimicrobia bacterium]|nr:glycosyltransferase [Candidatus Neomarinimicrobiota bacterium]